MGKPGTRKRRYEDAREILPAAFTHRLDLNGIAADRGFALLTAYRTSRTAESFHAAVEYFLPFIFSTVLHLKRRRPGYYTESVEELVSDGTPGLLNALRSERECPDLQAFRFRAYKAIDNAIRREKESRWWGKRPPRPQRNLTKRFRRAFLREHGRMPSAAEMNEQLAALIVNPLIVKPLKMLTFSQARDPDRFEASLAAREHCAPDADAEERHRDVLGLARKTLNGAEREIFNMAIDGMGASEIAHALKLDPLTLRRRLYGILWELRSRVDLADALGVVPEKRSRGDHVRAPWKHPARLVG